MNWTDRRKRFRSVLAGERCVHPGSVYDAISARIAEDLGFEIGMFAGSVASMTVLGAPDLIVLTLSEFAGQAYRINRAGNLPLMVDADHGYGNALSVKRTVEELETAGVGGMSIEDTELPQPFGAAKPRLIPVAEGVGKMKAALAGRQDPALCIAGRTSAIQISGLEDAIARGKAYEAVGVDALFFVGIKSRAELDAISAATRLPLILGGVSGELTDLDYLSARRVRIALQGHQPFAAAVKAVHDTLKALREGTAPSKLTGIADAELMKRVTREADYTAWTKDFLS
ncbi:carboxyvinyl-carboxyphosphonate phosphorylmutase [Enhydrobacter aerosaccus]|uniref:Oxaloacetate decarboxylase n=1 Tax=Enhydrobacter aerosaccus TaxID=225324 RepID=A0A1T4R6W1_9HYPH|nr:isocitrate lyase/PEP mutase family protein [Enhydrobacter aerosaccus]SKA11822.1 carboxyvinyl-carboxyphosphonate phosphorylmutase [Enhydrobacter aerosaccus]